MRYELTDFEWTAIKPMLPNKPRGVPRIDDRRVLNGPINPPSAGSSSGPIEGKRYCAARAVIISALVMNWA